ncbi:hypothetical protein QO034_06570 [Sedimentitalea sp. JM2-8]|uniref:Uncharacterized protein n=1 Tax=Sedimentitalea xiamensis TaxID=3050037 RepID=A0ABT7FCM0_9RHOB|nr:hypothetical protein [Sedimentitalea xiamensis]MDK3072768.1 hypothetical protein [Sedimentitalea xiamensis]
MTKQTLPATGGRFLRHEDDALERIEDTPEARKPAAKTPVKKKDEK